MNDIIKFCSEEHGKAQNQFWPVVMFLDPDFELWLPNLTSKETVLYSPDGGKSYKRHIFLKNYGSEHLLLHAGASPDSKCKVIVSEHLRPGGTGVLEFSHGGEAHDGIIAFDLHHEVVQPIDSTIAVEQGGAISFYLDPDHDLPIPSLTEGLGQFGLVGKDDGTFHRKIHLENITGNHYLLFCGTNNPSVRAEATQHLRPYGSGVLEIVYTGEPVEGGVEYSLTFEAEIVSNESEHLPGLKAEVLNS